jgi:hypothetical protein
LKEGEVAETHVYDFYNAGFVTVSCENFFWKTRYTKESLWSLFKNTPTIENFDPQNDKDTFDLAWSEIAVKDIVTLTQHRVLVIAKV